MSFLYTSILAWAVSVAPNATAAKACDSYWSTRGALVDAALAAFAKGRGPAQERAMRRLRAVDELWSLACADDRASESHESRAGASPGAGGLRGREAEPAVGEEAALDEEAREKSMALLQSRARALPPSPGGVAGCLSRQEPCGLGGGSATRSRLLKAAVVYAPREKLRWGKDGRRAPASPGERAVARATVAIVHATPMTRKVDRWHIGPVLRLDETIPNLCPDERFLDEPSVADCSGVLVAPQWVATARHCAVAKVGLRVVFGFGHPAPPVLVRTGAGAFLEVGVDDVFEVVEVRPSERPDDWALLKLDRPASATPLVLERNRVVDDTSQEFAVSGHPIGLPLKYADGARILSVGAAEDAAVFHATLDTYGGNSGSPVVDQATSRVVGLLSAGDGDFVEDTRRSCTRSRVCGPGQYCSGERVQRIDGSFAVAWQALTQGSGGEPAKKKNR